MNGNPAIFGKTKETPAVPAGFAPGGYNIQNQAGCGIKEKTQKDRQRCESPE